MGRGHWALRNIEQRTLFCLIFWLVFVLKDRALAIFPQRRRWGHFEDVFLRMIKNV
jgi:hypothetical protein